MAGPKGRKKQNPPPTLRDHEPQRAAVSSKLCPELSKRGGSLYLSVGKEDFQVTCLCSFSMVPKNLLGLTSNVYSNLASTPLSAGHTKLEAHSDLAPDTAQRICFYAQVPLLRGPPTPTPPHFSD